MSLEMTFRQKLIRIGCSAAICGLSFSFIIGEAVDREAKLLRTWTVDPALIPEAYLPLRPVTIAVNQLESPKWREQLVATNSLSIKSMPATEGSSSIAVLAQVPPAPLYIRAISPEPAKAIPSPETVKIVSAAPDQQQSHPRAPEPELRHSEVEVILASIHSATAKLSRQAVQARPDENAPAVTKTSSPKSPEELPMVREKPKVPPAMIASARKPPADPSAIAGPWILSGRILSSTAQVTEPGHYEVGLFSKIDPENNPVGFPLPQQILPAGQNTFRLEVPHRVERGYLFAEFVSAKTGKRTLIMPGVNPWLRGNHLNAELLYRAEDKISSIAASVGKDAPKEQWKLRGTVTTMFAGQGKIPQGDVVVKLRGRKEAARTDSSGNFSLELPKLRGTLFLEVLKTGYHPAIVTVSADDLQPLQVEIASRHAVEQLSQRLGSNQSGTKGIFIGRALAADGAGLKGLTAQLSLKADGPFYFDDDGVATRDLRSTSGNGRFLFLNVESGTGYLEASINGEAVAPLQVSTVEGGEMIQKNLTAVSGTLRGRVFNPVAEPGKMVPIGGARVRIDGASDWVSTDSFGAFSIGPLKWFKGERIALELTAEKFSNHRYQASPDGGAGLNLFAFPAQYIARLARSMDLDLDPYAGVIVGKVSGTSVRMDALADHSVVNSARDFYFDAKGRLRGSHEMTDPRYGTYVIFNVPKGRTLLHGNDSTGQLRYSEGVVSSAASINVMMD